MTSKPRFNYCQCQILEWGVCELCAANKPPSEALSALNLWNKYVKMHGQSAVTYDDFMKDLQLLNAAPKADVDLVAAIKCFEAKDNAQQIYEKLNHWQSRCVLDLYIAAKEYLNQHTGGASE